MYLALLEAPSFVGRAGFTAPLTWKLFFFHVPIAFASFGAFAVAFYQGLRYLARASPWRDLAAQSAVEAGLTLSGLTLVTGMIWGQAEWGVAWRWSDAKLVVVLLMFLLYAGYVVLRGQIDDPDRRARVSAVYATAGFATVPLAWFAQRIWLSFHPTVFGSQDVDTGVVTPGILPIFLLALAVFAAIASDLYRRRLRLLLHAEARQDEQEAVA